MAWTGRFLPHRLFFFMVHRPEMPMITFQGLARISVLVHRWCLSLVQGVEFYFSRPL